MASVPLCERNSALYGHLNRKCTAANGSVNTMSKDGEVSGVWTCFHGPPISYKLTPQIPVRSVGNKVFDDHHALAVKRAGIRRLD